MLRRFNSLIKGPKVQSDVEESTEQVSLRPARSVDSSLFVSPQRGGVATVSGLNPSLLARRAEDGQTSLNVTVPLKHQRQEEPERGVRAFAIGRVAEERSWKEGYEQANLDSPGTPQEQYEPGEKPSDHGSHGGVTEPHDSVTPPTVLAQISGDEQAAALEFLPVIPPQRQFELGVPRVSRASSDAVVLMCDTVLDIPDTRTGSGVDLEDLRKLSVTGPGRTISSWSTDSAAEHCRICQTHSEEPLIELGCLCRGEMAKSHKSCIETWFKNRGTNKCEVCQHVASNVPAPETSPMPHFWVWRLGGPQGAAQELASQANASRVGFQRGLIVNRPVLLMIIKKHPFIPVMWISLLAFMTYLFVDAINTSTIGYAAMPIGFLFGVLVVLGLGTAVRLVMECCHERAVERSIRQMELLSVDPEPVQAGAEESTAPNRPALPV